ncbi:MAG: hypothetical protein ACYCZP_05120 [Acidimicrobiales bacterium]
MRAAVRQDRRPRSWVVEPRIRLSGPSGLSLGFVHLTPAAPHTNVLFQLKSV